jgi:hypothetical protein
MTLNLEGTVSASGAITGTYDGNPGSVEGTFTGMVKSGTLQLSLMGTTLSCHHTDSISGSLYAPPAGGGALTNIMNHLFTFKITAGTGVFAASGRLEVLLDAFGKFTYSGGSGSGGYEFSKTAPNIDTLKLYDSSLQDIVTYTLTFGTGTYTAVAESFSGSQEGTFRFLRPPHGD